MRLMNVAAIFAAGMMISGCETTGAGTSGMGGLGGAIAQSAVAAGTQAAIGSAVPAAAPAAAAYAPAGSYANDPVAIAYAQQQAAKQGVTLTPEQAALALQMAEQQQASGGSLDANSMAEAAARQAAAAGFAQQAAAAGIPLGTALMGQAGAAATPAVATAPAAGTGIPDAQKSCEQLAAEIGEQQQIIAAANDSATNAQVVNAGVGIAQSLGMHFGGFGLGGIQAAGAAGNAAAQQGQAAQQQAQQAEIRLQVLNGFHQGKGCAA